VTGEEWALAVTAFSTGLAPGFFEALCTIIRPMQAAMDGRGFRTFMETFPTVIQLELPGERRP
jgi:hypothetical protein